MTDIAQLGFSVDSAPLKTAARDLDHMGVSAKKAEKTTGESTKKMSEGFNTGASAVKSMVFQVAALVGATAALSGATKTIIGFESAMSSVRAITRATDDQMQQLTKTARTLGATTSFSAGQAAEAIQFLGMAGFSTNQIIQAMPSTLALARAGALDLGSAADIASNALSGFRLEASDMGMVADTLAAASSRSNTNVRQLGEAMSYAAPFAAALNVTVQETTASIGALSDAGLQGGRAGTGLSGFFRQLTNVTTEGEKTLAQYGITLDDVNVKTRGLNNVLSTLSQAGISAGDTLKIFGSEAGLAASILIGASDKVVDLTNELKAAGGEAERMAEQMGDNLSGDMMTLQSAISEAALSLNEYTGASEKMRSIVQTSTSAISQFNAQLNAGELNGVAMAMISLSGGVAAVGIAYGAVATATWLATSAQTAFNIAARANPYALIATAAIGAAGAIYAFVNAQTSAVDIWKRAAESEEAYLSAIANNAAANRVQEIVNERAKKEEELQKLREKGFKRYSAAANKERALLQDLVDLRKEYDEIINARIDAEKAQSARLAERKAEELKLEQASLDGKKRQAEIEKAMQDSMDESRRRSEQSRIDNELATLKALQDADKSRVESVLASLDDEVQAVKRSYNNRAAIIKASTTLQEEEKRAIILRLAEQLEDDLAEIAERSGKKFASPWAGVSDQIASDLQTAITRGDWQGIGASIGGALAGGISRSVTQGLTSAIGDSLGAAGGLVAGVGGAVAGGLIGGILSGSTTKVVGEWMQFNLNGLMLNAAEMVKTRRTTAFGSSTRVASQAISDAITSQITNSLELAAVDIERNLRALGADISAGMSEFEFSARASNPAEFLQMAAEEYSRQALAAATIYQRSGETLNQTIARLADASGAVSAALRTLGTDIGSAALEAEQSIRSGIEAQIESTRERIEELERITSQTVSGGPRSGASILRQIRDAIPNLAIEQENLALLTAQLADASNAAGIAVEQGLIDSIVKLTGVSSAEGVRELQRLTDAFDQMAFTVEELAQRDIEDARKTLRALGIDGIDASADVATLSQQLRDLRGGSAETSAELLVAAGAVLSLSDATERLEGAAGSATNSVESLLSALSFDTDRAFGRLQASISSQQKALRDAASAEIEAIRAQTNARLEANKLASDAAREGLRAIQREVSGIQSATSSLRNELDPIQTARRQTALARLARAIETGDLTGTGDAAELASRINADQYTNSADYQREQARTLFLLSSLEKEGQEQLSTAEQAIQRLDRQSDIIKAEGDRAIQAAQNRLDVELAKLDEQLSASRIQIDALRGIDESILSVADAIRELASALGRERPAAIEQAYRTIAGRDPDREGFEWWQNAFRTGTATMADLEYALRQETGEIPMFENGGSFGGGLRVVGERGAELEMTGASRIMSNADLMRALGANRELAAEMKAMHYDMMIGLNQLAKNTHKTSKQLERWDLTGLPEDRVIA